MSDTNLTGDQLPRRVLDDFARSWADHGTDTVEKLRNDKPETYVRLATGFATKNAGASDDDFETMSDEQLLKFVKRVGKGLGVDIETLSITPNSKKR